MFKDRAEAGRHLAEALAHLASRDDVVVVGLPRGGVPVAAAVAAAIDAPLDIILVRKLGVPLQPELAMGAIGEAGTRVLNDDVVEMAGVGPADIDGVERRERVELERRARRFRGDRQAVPLAGRTVVVVDDGIATGSTARVACEVARARGASQVVLAVPVAPPEWTVRLAGAADELIAVETPEPFYAIGQFYQDFSQTGDEEVIDCLRQARQSQVDHAAVAGSSRNEEVVISVGQVEVHGHLRVPEGATATVVFAHGSGSSRHSPRNRYVAGVLNEAGLATLLFDLLTEQEELDRANVFDIELLAQRLAEVSTWVRQQPETADLPICYFGASTGAAAALAAAAEVDDIAAVVSRGGRPDLAGARLSSVRAPTLLIVGSLDEAVLDLNRQAQARLQCPSEVKIVPGASHLFEEPGTLALAAAAARDWLARHSRQTVPGAGS